MFAHRKLLISLFIASAIFLFFPKTVFAVSFINQTSQTQIKWDEELLVNSQLNISLANGTKNYLRGVFYKEGSSNYCGYTHNGNNWYRGPYDSSSAMENLLPVTIQSSSWSGILKAKFDLEDSVCNIPGVYKFKIWRYNSSGNPSSNDVQNELTMEVIFPTLTPTEKLSPTDTLTPTPTPSPAPTIVPKAVYKINKSKDEDGEILSSVKIYVDDQYTHHVDDQTLTFCPGCHCDDDHNIDCELGQHTIRTEKDGYENWQETKTFIDGDNFEVNPVMAEISPSSTPTLSPTPTLTPRPTSTSKPTPSLTPTLTPSLKPEVLGENVSSESAGEGLPPKVSSESGITQEKSLFKYLPAFLIIAGVIFIAVSIFLFFKTKEKLGDFQ